MPPTKTVEEHAREQTTFLKEKLEPRRKQARRGRRQVYFVDAAHFVFAPFLGFLWCAVRLFVRAASGRKRYNVLGAMGRGDAPVAPGDEPRLHQRRVGLCPAAGRRRSQRGLADHVGAGQRPVSKSAP